MPAKQNLSIFNLDLSTGGAEKVTSLLLKELVNDYNVYLILMYNNIHFPIPEDVNVVFLEDEKYTNHWLYKYLDVVKFIFKYKKTLKEKNIEYAISLLNRPNLINGLVSIFHKKTQYIISERGFPSDNFTSKLSLALSKFLYPLLYNRCDKLFSNSVYINEDLKNNFGIKIPMEVIYNPIEIPEKTINPSNLSKPTEVIKVVTAGTLNTRKNQIMIIKSIESSSKNYKLEILGEGHLKNDLLNAINEKGLEDQIFLLGRVNNVNDYLIQNHCFVLSSFTEGFPNALMEAMASGLPCISTNCLSGPLELLHENKDIEIGHGEFFKAKYGILINNDDDEALKKALDYLSDNPRERERYSRLSLERSNDYVLKKIYLNFNEFLNKKYTL